VPLLLRICPLAKCTFRLVTYNHEEEEEEEEEEEG